MVAPSRRCKKKLSKHSRLDPAPPKKAIRVCETPNSNTMMCSTVAIPTAVSSSSSSSRTVTYTNNKVLTRPSTIATNTNVGATIRTKAFIEKNPNRTNVTNGKSTTSSSADDKSLFEVDRTIQSLFKVGERLGKGAYGVVWSAEDKKTGRKLALKKIFDAFRNGTDAQRTYREIIFLRELGRHPNIINLLSFHKAINNLDIYLTFPLLDSDLHKIIKQGTHLTDTAIRFIFYQILKAVKFLHSAEVIHRDLKPANILLDKNLTKVKVADFGLARSLVGMSQGHDSHDLDEGDTLLTEYVATRWYRPPEILLSNTRYSKGVDMWGLGCILGEMLLRKAVFAGSTTMEQIQIIMKTLPRPHTEEILELCNTQAKISVVENAANNPEMTLYELFMEQSCCPSAIDLVEQLLVFHPDQRISIEEAISHSYVAKFRLEAEEILMTAPVAPPLNDNVQLNLKEYRSAIYDLLRPSKPRRPQTSIVSSRPVSTPRTLTFSRDMSEKHMPPKTSMRPPVGRRNSQSQLLNNASSDNMNGNCRLKAIKSSIACGLNKEPTVEHQFGQEECSSYFSGAGDQNEFYSSICNPSPAKPSSEGKLYEHARMMCSDQNIMESIAELDQMDVSGECEEEFAKENQFSLPTIRVRRCDDAAPPSRGAPSEINLQNEFDRFGIVGQLHEDNCSVDDEVRTIKTNNLPKRKERVAYQIHPTGNDFGKPDENMTRPSRGLNNRPLRSREKPNTISNQDLGLSEKPREKTPDWHYRGIGRGRQVSQNTKTQHQKQVSQARPPQKPPTRAFSFQADENRPRVQHSSYFPDKHISPYNPKRSSLGLPKSRQQTEVFKQRGATYQSYTPQSHATISASELSELKNFTLNSKK